MVKRVSLASNADSPRKRRRSFSPDTDASDDGCSDVEHEDAIKIFIVPAKLDSSSIEELTSLIDHACGPSQLSFTLVHEPSEADIIVTAVHMRQRLERHVPWSVAVSLSEL
jgi:hypothetical protein